MNMSLMAKLLLSILAVTAVLVVMIPTAHCSDCVRDTANPGCKAVCDGVTLDISSVFSYP